MAYYPQNATGLNYITYPVGPTPSAISITPSASANTKGAYSEITSSLPFTCNSCQIMAAGSVNNAQCWLFDISLGPSGSEVVLIPNVINDQSNTGSSIGNAGSYNVNAAISSGTRIAARCQCNIGSRTLGLSMSVAAAGGVNGISAFTDYGSNTAGSRGTNIDPGGVANTKGSYSEITASSSSVIQWLMVSFAHFGSSAPNGQGWEFDIATGGSGSEVILIPDLLLRRPAATLISNPRSYSLLTYIAASTRIAVRASSDLASISTSPGRTMDVAITGGVAPSEPSGGGGAWAFA